MNKKTFDLNTVIGFLLIGGIFLWFGYFGRDDKAVDAQQPATNDTAQVVNESIEVSSTADTVVTDLNTSQLDTVPVVIQEEELFILENDKLEITISSKGGQIVKARLKEYLTYDTLPLYLIDRKNTQFDIQLGKEKTTHTADLDFRGVKKGENEIQLTLNLGGGKTLEYVYKIDDTYMLAWDIRSTGLRDMITEKSGLQWQMQTLRHEKNLKNEGTNTYLNYRFSNDDDSDDLSATGDDNEAEENIKWVAYKQQFFSSILFNKGGDFQKAELLSRVAPEGEEGFTKELASKVTIASIGGEINNQYGLYLGPNKYDILNEYDEGFEELIPLGWGILGWINRGLVIPLFDGLAGFGLSYGLIILIIALVIKLALFPFTYTSYRSMAKMRVLKPEIDELNEQFKDKEAMKKQQATMELYRKAGVNPLGGCIPVLFQMPVLIALFRFFPSSIELRQQPFLWAHDLSTYDSIWTFGYVPIIDTIYGDHVSLFTLLMTVSTLIYTYMNQQLTGSNQQYPQLKYMMYLMPVVFLGVFNNYAAGLSYYYFVANVITFTQQFAIRSFIDEDKIRAKIQEKKAKPKKENRFTRRMKELQEEQNRQARRKK